MRDLRYAGPSPIRASALAAAVVLLAATAAWSQGKKGQPTPAPGEHTGLKVGVR